MEVTEIVLALINKHPVVGTFVAAIGTARLFVKPIRDIIKATPTKKDDEILAQIESSKWWKATTWTLNWLTSIHLSQK